MVVCGFHSYLLISLFAVTAGDSHVIKSVLSHDIQVTFFLPIHICEVFLSFHPYRLVNSEVDGAQVHLSFPLLCSLILLCHYNIDFFNPSGQKNHSFIHRSSPETNNSGLIIEP